MGVSRSPLQWRSFPRGGSSADGNFFEPESTAGFNYAMSIAGDDTLIVIDFGATWCGPCQRIAPEFKRIANENAPIVEDSKIPLNVMFIKVDTDKIPSVTNNFKVSSLPTFVFIRNGQELKRFSGADVDKLTSFVDELRSK